MIITREFNFDAAHYLENYDGKCANLHGHTFFLSISLKGNADPKTDMVLDFTKLKAIVNEEIIEVLDHKYLNDVLDFNPTCENIAKWIYDKLKMRLCDLHSVELKEGLGGSAEYSLD